MKHLVELNFNTMYLKTLNQKTEASLNHKSTGIDIAGTESIK